jgi:hypothetical protein
MPKARSSGSKLLHWVIIMWDMNIFDSVNSCNIYFLYSLVQIKLVLFCHWNASCELRGIEKHLDSRQWADFRTCPLHCCSEPMSCSIRQPEPFFQPCFKVLSLNPCHHGMKSGFPSFFFLVAESALK